MNYSLMDECMQALFEQYVPLDAAKQKRLSQFCSSQILAGTSHITKLAPWLKRDAKQGNREQWLYRLLQAPFVRQEYVYRPRLKQALTGYDVGCWHLIIDRSNLVSKQVDLVTVALSYRKRAIPLKWQQIAYGGEAVQTYIDLLKGCKTLLPSDATVMVHGDSEFGAIPMLRFLRQQNWDYILGQSSHCQGCLMNHPYWQALADYSLPKRRGLYLEKLVLTKEHEYPFANLFGFLHKNKQGDLEKRFYATSLPITASLRRFGKRRWGIEPYFRDMKSSGWQLDQSLLCDPTAREALLVLLSCTCFWLTCLGRWLCKTQQRHFVDSHPSRQHSLFRLGWDWLVYQFRQQAFIPHLLTLYS